MNTQSTEIYLDPMLVNNLGEIMLEKGEMSEFKFLNDIADFADHNMIPQKETLIVSTSLPLGAIHRILRELGLQEPKIEVKTCRIAFNFKDFFHREKTIKITF